jgi:uncharacterized protein (TIGR03435 family)
MIATSIGGPVALKWIAHAQTGPVFEVSEAPVGGRGGVAGRGPVNGAARISRTPQRIALKAALVGDIMVFAYGFPLDRIERRPQWMYDDRYDVAVTTAAPVGLPEQKLMLQKLLETRFNLVVRRVSNESPVYFLVAGAKVNLPAAAQSGAADLPEFRTAWGLEVSPGILLQGGASGPPMLVGTGRHVSMADLAAWLYTPLQLPVLDKTGIAGIFDIEIPALPVKGGAEGTIRTVRNALGLDLELHRGTAESLIIDKVEKPKQN